MFAGLRNLFNRGRRRPRVNADERQQAVRAAVNRVLARYDMAQTTGENRRHWASADSLSADAANSPEVRRLLRNRARYEVGQNGYAKGIVSTLANDVIGYGPRLQVLGLDRGLAKEIEDKFAEWGMAINLPGKLHLMRRTRAIDGEAVGVLTTKRTLDTPVKLNLRLVDCERMATPDLMPLTENAVDGVVFDEDGDAVEYHILHGHPGGMAGLRDLEYDRHPPRFVLHYFRPERPEQHRGICEILPALPLGAQLRRYTLATLTAAEVAALLTLLLETEVPGDDEDLQEFQLLEIERGMMTVVPNGWKGRQLQAEQPTTVYPQFKHEIVGEMGRGVDMPYNIAAANSSAYNYASGRLDHLSYDLGIVIDRELTAREILDRILAEWLREARTIPGFLPVTLDRPYIRHQWFWRGRERGVDPAKEANARDTDLKNGMTSHPLEYARRGLDWEEEQQKAAEALGLSIDEYRQRLCEHLFSGAREATGANDEEEAEGRESEDR